MQGIVGNLASGKSALVHRYLTGTYVQEESPEGTCFALSNGQVKYEDPLKAFVISLTVFILCNIINSLYNSLQCFWKALQWCMYVLLFLNPVKVLKLCVNTVNIPLFSVLPRHSLDALLIFFLSALSFSYSLFPHTCC